MSNTKLPDIQKTKMTTNIGINEVGVTNLRYPIEVFTGKKKPCNTIGTFNLTVNLPGDQKGTHMSRFVEVINDVILKRNMRIDKNSMKCIVTEIKDVLRSSEAFIDLIFPIFLKKTSPVSRIDSLLDYTCRIRCGIFDDNTYETIIGANVLLTTCCPCSREISDNGAHNQRSQVKIRIRPVNNSDIWFSDIIEIAEKNSSCELYSLLKRIDEKHVTERSYNNAKFVEDIVRDVSVDLDELLYQTKEISWYYVTSENYESIHSHNAFARIEQGSRARLDSYE